MSASLRLPFQFPLYALFQLNFLSLKQTLRLQVKHFFQLKFIQLKEKNLSAVGMATLLIHNNSHPKKCRQPVLFFDIPLAVLLFDDHGFYYILK